MFTPTSSPGSRPDGTMVQVQEPAPNPGEPRSEEENGFAVVLDGSGRPLTSTRAQAGADFGRSAQNMPSTTDGAARDIPPAGPWPVLDRIAETAGPVDVTKGNRTTESGAVRTAAVEEFDGTPQMKATSSSVVEHSESMRTTGRSDLIPSAGDPNFLPVGGELQRVEMAVELSKLSGLDARSLLSPPPAPVSMQEPGGGRATSVHASVNGTGPGAAQGLLTSLTTLAAGSGGLAKLTLDPPLLGTVTVQMTVHAGGVTCTLHAERTAGAEALVRDLASLRSGFEGKGLVVDRLVVQGPQGMETEYAPQDPGPESEEDGARKDQGHRRRPAKGSPAADEHWLFEDMLAIQPDRIGPIEGGHP